MQKMFKTTCVDVWRQEEESCKIITLCKGLDEHLGGGISSGIITEFCGAPGSGKTQMCLQLSINVQFPTSAGGIGGRVVYVDTNQDFHPERLKELADGMSQRFQRTPHEFSDRQPFSWLENVAYTYCPNYVQLRAFVTNLSKMLSADSKLKLVIIDSFSFPLRFIADVSQRKGFVYELLNDLQKLASRFSIAVVITNELTTRITGINWKIVPALGELHAHKINQRIILSKEKGTSNHLAMIEKSLISPKVIIPFKIRQSGIRGLSS